MTDDEWNVRGRVFSSIWRLGLHKRLLCMEKRHIRIHRMRKGWHCRHCRRKGWQNKPMEHRHKLSRLDAQHVLRELQQVRQQRWRKQQSTERSGNVFNNFTCLQTLCGLLLSWTFWVFGFCLVISLRRFWKDWWFRTKLRVFLYQLKLSCNWVGGWWMDESITIFLQVQGRSVKPVCWLYLVWFSFVLFNSN